MFLYDFSNIKKFLDCDSINTIAAVLKTIFQNCIEKEVQSQVITLEHYNYIIGRLNETETAALI